MKKNPLIIIMVILPIHLWAHSLLLNVFDNEDNTITVEGQFNTGESAAGALIKLEALSNNAILYEKRLPEESELTIQIPKEPYQIILDGGPGHQIIKAGVEPLNGYEKQSKTKSKQAQRKKQVQGMSQATLVCIILAFLLLFATIYINIKNTNKLIKVMKN